jgi:asparagine synthase (glutamine-hydrolysing)
MSGIVGIVNLDGAPVDRSLLEKMTDFMALRGPDARGIWVDGHIGFSHTMLRTTRESENEQQPCSLDGRVWITADARVDGRNDLVRLLTANGRDNVKHATDPELILHAYHAWGESCVEHLLGDFAFAIWDGDRRRLFCARDHFGVKPFYYSRVGESLIFSNTLNCVRLHPGVSDKLNELAIADFLLFEENRDAFTTSFADVGRLPSAHTLTCSDRTVRVDRYWTLPAHGKIRYRRPEEYADHLKELLRCAVADRLRTSRVGVRMSGGLDSSSVAAVARSLVSDGSASTQLKAFTMVFDSLIPDQERTYAGLTARALDIPIDFLSMDGYGLYDGWDRPELYSPEPFNGTYRLAFHDLLLRAATHGRVILTGDGGDPAMLGSATYALSLLRNGCWGHLAVDFWNSLSCGYLPKIGIRARLRRRTRPASHFPDWINPKLAARLDLAARWSGVNAEEPPLRCHRAEAWRCLTGPHWAQCFESVDPGVTLLPVEHREPFLDLRVLTYLLAIPPLPWCDNKEVVRLAMAGLLPELVRRRPKTPLAGDPTREVLHRKESLWVDRFEAVPELDEYVLRDRIPRLLAEPGSNAILSNLRPLSLNFWLPNRNDPIISWRQSVGRASREFDRPIAASVRLTKTCIPSVASGGNQAPENYPEARV